jgi:hypothetical protein
MIHTDAAWQLDQPERFQTEDELITVTPEDHERLANIVDAIGVVSLEGGNECLGTNLPRHTAGALSVDNRSTEDSAHSDVSGGDRGPARV